MTLPLSRIRILPVTLILLVALASCGGSLSGTGDSDNDSSGGDSTDNASGTDSDNDSAAAAVEAGSTGVFASLSSSSSDTVTVDGESITVEEGTSYIYRYLVEGPSAARLDDTYDLFNSYSCDSAGDQFPYTSGQTLLNVEACPDIDDYVITLDIEEIDPETGELDGSTCSFDAAGSSPFSLNLAYLSGTLYYVNTDGDFVTRSLATCGAETVLLDSGEGDNSGAEFFNIDGQLIALVNDTVNDVYTVKSLNTSTGAATATLIAFEFDDPDNAEYDFYEGDDALYWYEYYTSSQSFRVYRYVPGEDDLEEIYSVTLSDNLTGASIDASGDKVLIAYQHVGSRDSNGYATSQTIVGKLYDLDTGTSTTLELDEFFNSGLMQVLVFE